MHPTRYVAAVAVSLALLVGLGPNALGQSDGSLAVDVSVDEASADLARAEATVDQLRTDLYVLRAERSEYARRLAQRDARRDQAVRELRSARTEAERLVIAAYMGAGSTPTAETVAFSGESPLDYTYQATLVQDSTEARYRATGYYDDLRAQATDAIRRTVDHLDQLDRAIGLTQLALGEAEDAIRTAEIVLAQAEAAEAAARQAFDSGAPGPPPGGGWVPLGQWPGGPSYAQWSALRQCESGGNYQAVSPSGLYRGAFQFDLGTWASVGGSGDPAMAPPAEQDHRAQVLWSQRGPGPWPICGRYLS